MIFQKITHGEIITEVSCGGPEEGWGLFYRNLQINRGAFNNTSGPTIVAFLKVHVVPDQ